MNAATARTKAEAATAAWREAWQAVLDHDASVDTGNRGILDAGTAVPVGFWERRRELYEAVREAELVEHRAWLAVDALEGAAA